MVYSLMKIKVVKYNALPGVMAQPINSWGDFKKALTELRDPEVQEMFETV